MNVRKLIRCIVALTLAVIAYPVAAQNASDPVAAALKKADYQIERVIAEMAPRSFENTMLALDDVMTQLRLDTEFLQFMAYVSPNAELRNSATTAEKDVRNWLINLQSREDLYMAVKEFADSKPRLDPIRQRLLDHSLRDFRRAGMALTAEQREELKSMQKELTELSLQFEKNIREDETKVFFTKAELAGMPADYIAGLTETNGIYLIGMDYPTFLPLMDYCENEITRKKAWLAYKRRGGQRNVDLIEKIIKLRANVAKMLGYQHPADYETEVKMARSAKTVQDFFAKLQPLVRKKALIDKQEFEEAKQVHTGKKDVTLYPWDTSFYEKRLLKDKYAVDSEKVREYFPMERVINGLFSITESLYGVKYRDITKTVTADKGFKLWHEDVLSYEVIDVGSNEVLGTFFLDLHPRDNKYGHAAQWGLHPRAIRKDGSLQKPVAALVCNFTKPTESKPSLLSHDEVETFFHEFGHLLHSLLTNVDIGEFSGTSVARDFVEAPSQMFEHWVWDADVLKTFARHYKTGESFPQELLDGMIKARYLASGIKAERQIFYGKFDMACHTVPSGDVDTTALALKLADECEIYDSVPETRFHAAFGHLTGYQAGYYGYLWSLVYAEDMFQRFQELGMLNPKAGAYYRDKVLSRGGTKDEMDLLRDYLGREPRMEPFLKHLGLEVAE